MKGLLYKEVVSLLGMYKKNLALVAVIYGALSVMTRNNFFLFFGIWMMGFYSLSNFSLTRPAAGTATPGPCPSATGRSWGPNS